MVCKNLESMCLYYISLEKGLNTGTIDSFPEHILIFLIAWLPPALCKHAVNIQDLWFQNRNYCLVYAFNFHFRSQSLVCNLNKRLISLIDQPSRKGKIVKIDSCISKYILELDNSSVLRDKCEDIRYTGWVKTLWKTRK